MGWRHCGIGKEKSRGSDASEQDVAFGRRTFFFMDLGVVIHQVCIQVRVRTVYDQWKDVSVKDSSTPGRIPTQSLTQSPAQTWTQIQTQCFEIPHWLMYCNITFMYFVMV